MLLLDRPFPEDQLAASTELDLRNVGPKVWPKVVAGCRATDLRLYHVTLSSLAGLEKLSIVRKLVVEWAPKLEDLTPVFGLEQLTSLSITDCKRVRSLAGIEALEELTELDLSGNRTTLTPPLILASIEPVSRLPALRRLSIANTKLEDDDITVLARCPELRELELSNQFELAQVAYLAKRLNPRLIEPLTASHETTLICEKCGGPKSMLTKRGRSFLCRVCDRARYDAHVAEFERLVRDS